MDADPLDLVVRTPSPGGSSESVDPLDLVVRNEPRSSVSAAPSAPTATTRQPAPARRQTVYQQARSAPARKEPDLNLQQALRMAGQNFGSSAKGAGSAMLQSVLHPIETVGSLASLGRGTGSLIGKKFGYNQGPASAQTAKDEALARSLADQYKQTYGSKQGFYRALATDPVSIAMDVSTPLTLGAGAAATGLKGASQTARLAGNLAKANQLSTAAKVASGVSIATDPLGLAMKAATYPITRAAIPVASNLLSGSSMSSLIKAAQAGESTNPAIRRAFKDFSTGKSKASEVIDTLDNAFTDISSRRGSQYVESMMKATNGNLPALDWNPITSSINGLRRNSSINYVDSVTGKRIPVNPTANAVIDEIEAAVSAYSNQPAGAGSHTLLGFDSLKKTIDNIRSANKSDPVAYMAATEMRNSVKAAIQRQHPEYAQIMDEYATASDHMANIRNTLGVGKRSASDEKILRNVLRAKKTGKGENLVKSLSAERPELAYNLAGLELNPALPGGLRNVIMGGGLLYGATPAGIAHLAAASPRAAGAAQYALGQATRIAPTAGKVAYFAGRENEEANPKDLPGGFNFESAAKALGDPGLATIAAGIRFAEGTGPNRDGTSSAQGPYQFTKGAFVDIFKKTYPDRAARMTDEQIEALQKSPERDFLQEEMGPVLLKENAGILQSNGFPLTPRNLYAMHFLGPAGGPRLLRANPSAPVETAVTSEAYVANKKMLRGKTVGQLLDEIDRRITVGIENTSKRATGGRIQRASGGRTGQSHEQLVNRLMTMAKQAKKATDESTEPLLNAPDEAIVKALDVAQQAI